MIDSQSYLHQVGNQPIWPGVFRWIICLCILLLISACRISAEDSQWVLSSLCDPPCWQNIEPGETRSLEIQRLLGDIAFVAKDSIEVQGATRQGFSELVKFSLGESGLVGKVYFLDDRVSLISFYKEVNLAVGGSMDIQLGFLIDHFGNPAILLPTRSLAPGIPLADTTHDIYYLIYPQIGIALSYDAYFLTEQDRSKVLPSNEIQRIMFFYPADFSFLIEKGFFGTAITSEDELRSLSQKWVGYGDYSREELGP
jgi:hypothetical protein